MASITLSIVTPVLDGRAGIERAMRSVHGESGTRDPRVEHLVFDAGSTDGTREWLESFAAHRPQIRLFFASDRGQSDAMNRGVREARGSVLGFLNADDFYEPGALTVACEGFERFPEPSILVGGCRVWDASANVLAVNRPERLRPESLLWGGWLRPHPYNPSGYFYHRSLHDRVGLYDVDDHFTMDLDFLLRALAVANVETTDRILGNYRWAPGTKTWEDRARGTSFGRKEAVFRKYDAELPFVGRALRRGFRWLTDTGLPRLLPL